MQYMIIYRNFVYITITKKKLKRHIILLYIYAHYLGMVISNISLILDD